MDLEKIRHSLAHILAQAVIDKFPQVKLGFGPATSTGFFYDFDFGDATITEKDLKDIQNKMKKLISASQDFIQRDVSFEEASSLMKGQDYKLEHLTKLKNEGENKFSIYTNTTFTDLCAGPHVTNSKEIPTDCFKLEKLAGAYWLGSEKNKMLTRIYGIAFSSKEELASFIQRRELAEKFDHKKLGKELDLYHQDDLVGKGLILWHPNGTVIRDEIEKYVKETEFRYGYKRVATPHITKGDLFKKSGHLAAYKDSMFPPMIMHDHDHTDGEESHGEEYYLKPMNCPFHHLIYASRKRSYRELPLRLAEYGTVYRNEQSGELSGLIRVRCMCMNDAHLYLRYDQFEEEFKKMLQMYIEFYDTFKLKGYRPRLSIRGEDNKEKFIGDPSIWDKSEALLAKALDEAGVDYYVGKGEAAFYGPKVDIQFKNLMGREETVSTIQVDYLAAEKFNLTYTDESGEEQPVLVLHRAPLSTHERFISFITEYYGGAFPTWCAPTQVCIVPVNTDCLEYAQELKNTLTAGYVRVTVDDTDNSFNKKIRTATVSKIPITLIVGNNEVSSGTVTVRRYGVEAQATVTKEQFIADLKKEISDRICTKEPMGSII